MLKNMFFYFFILFTYSNNIKMKNIMKKIMKIGMLILLTLIVIVSMGISDNKTVSVNNEITVEVEEKLIIEDWMLNDSLFNK